MILARRSFLSAGAAAASLLALPRHARAQTQAPPLLLGGAMRADLDFLVQAYGAIHPGLTRYLPASGFAARAEGAKRWADRERSLGDFYLMLARLTATVRCGHSFPNPNNQRPATREALFGARNRVPFAFTWIDGRMIVTRALSRRFDLPAGTEVLSINGAPARRMLHDMLPLTRADGSNDAKRLAQLGVTGLSRYEAFDLFRPLLYPSASGAALGLEIRDARGEERLLDVEATTEDERLPENLAGQDTPTWTFDVDRGVATLTMPTWALFDAKWDWAAYVDRVFDRLVDEKVPGLIIDLRGNEGGRGAVGDRMIARLIDMPLSLPAYRRLVRYRRVPEAMASALTTWDNSFKDWGDAASGPDSAGFYRLTRPDDDDGADLIRPSGRRYRGKVAILVDAACSSATFQFAQAVKEGRVGRLVGQATGGNQRGINGGAFFFLRLPNTGMEVDLPIIGYFPERARPDAGIAPDISVPVTRAHIATGFDAAKARARSLLGA